jgi:hypothetical protein
MVELRRWNAGVTVPASGGTYGPLHLAQQVQGWVLVLTKGAGRTEGPCRVNGDIDQRRSRHCACGPGARVVLRAPGRHDPTRGAPTKSERGLARAELHWWQGIVAVQRAHCRAVQVQFQRGRGWAPGQRAWGAPWGYGEAPARVGTS